MIYDSEQVIYAVNSLSFRSDWDEMTWKLFFCPLFSLLTNDMRINIKQLKTFTKRLTWCNFCFIWSQKTKHVIKCTIDWHLKKDAQMCWCKNTDGQVPFLSYCICSSLHHHTFGSGTHHNVFTTNKWSFLNIFQHALTLLNSFKCLSGRSATHQKATFSLLCFQKLLMLLNPFKILREWQIHIQFP